MTMAATDEMVYVSDRELSENETDRTSGPNKKTRLSIWTKTLFLLVKVLVSHTVCFARFVTHRWANMM